MLVVILLVGSLVVVAGLLILFLLCMARRVRKEAGTAGGMASKSAGNMAPTASPSKLLDIVKERYARGEITRDQYEQLKKDLS